MNQKKIKINTGYPYQWFGFMVLFLLLSLIGYGQFKVLKDSTIEVHGQWAKLRGRETVSDTSVYFIYSWRGLGKPDFTGLYEIYPNPVGRRKLTIIKLKTKDK